MTKIKLRTIATLLSVLIAISSLSIVSVSASTRRGHEIQFTTSSLSIVVIGDTTRTGRGHEIQFTTDDLQEFYNKFDDYFYAKRHLDNLGITDPDIINALAPLPDGYVIKKTSDPTQNLTDAELKTFLKQLKVYIDAINYLASFKTTQRKIGTLFETETVQKYDDSIIGEVVKFPAGITLEKLPDEEHPEGQIISRSDYSGIYGYVSRRVAGFTIEGSRGKDGYEVAALVNEFFTEYTQEFRDAYNIAINHFGSNDDTLSVLFWVDKTTVPPYDPGPQYGRVTTP